MKKKRNPTNQDVSYPDSGAVVSFYHDVSTGWEQWILLMSDNHHDSIFCNRDLELHHLQEAKRRKARVFILGDFFDAMQGRFDPRRSMAELRPEYRREDYYDFVVTDTRDFLLPFSDLIDVVSDGNHELSVLKNANTSLLDRLVYALNDKTGSKIRRGGYGGWVRFMFDMGGTRTSVKLKYFHGSGGDAPVTRGVIHTNRQAVYLPDANIVVNGHNHHYYYVPISRERLSGKGRQYFDIQHHIRIPGYKQDYGDGSTGWNITRGAPPKPIGAAWVRLFCESDSIGIQVIPDISGAQPISLDPNDFYRNGTRNENKVFSDDPEGV